MRTPEQIALNLSGYRYYSETLIESVDGRIALSLYPADRSDPCVVFLPGTMGHPLFYDEFLSRLAQSGFNVVGVHFVGHGKSPRHKRLFTFSDLVQNTRDAINYTVKRFNSNVVLLGSSQGGILGSVVATMEPRLKAVFAHNVILSELPETITITRFPSWFKPFYREIQKLVHGLAKLFPGLHIPIWAYLKPEKITASGEIFKNFLSDPLRAGSYPLCFVASLFNVDTSGLTDGSIRCPFVLIASRSDPLFSYHYVRRVFDRIAAPAKEMIEVDEPYHLLFNECTEAMIQALTGKLKKYTV